VDLEPHLASAGLLGAERLLCGGDWPFALLNGDCRRVWAEARRVVAAVAPHEEEQLLARTARRVYRLSGEAGDGAH
jgi:L-fuconolactonase